MITVLCGGVGAAKFLRGLVDVVDPTEIVAIVNTGDDVERHGLHVSPDIDTVIYTLADAINVETGWGLTDESWQAMDTLERYGGEAWFRLGDRDLGTHLFRTERLLRGEALGEVTAAIADAWGVEVRVVPVTDDRLRTRVSVRGEGEVEFQEYFVRRGHAVAVDAVRFDGASEAAPGPGVLDAIARADVVIVAPSNPLVSIGPVLAVPGVRAAVVARRASVVAVSPIVAGAALKGPADRMLVELGHEASVTGVARLYRDIAATLVCDEADIALADAVADAGMRPVIAPTIMHAPGAAAALARVVLDAAA